MLHVDCIDNFQTKALDVLRDLSAGAERADMAAALLSYRASVELKPSLSIRFQNPPAQAGSAP